MKYTLVLLSLNEIDGLKVIWPQIPKKSVDEIFAVDGGSTDGTLEFYKKNNIKVVTQKSKGRGEAFRIGIKEAKGDVVIFFSPDGNEDPKDISKFKKFFEADKDLDILIASRMMKGAYNEEDTGFFKPRKWVNNAFNFAANILFRRAGEYVTDTINGFRAIKKSSFEKLLPHSMKHTIEYEMTIKAFKQRMKVVEFPTNEGPRIGGYIKAKSLPTGIDFVRLFLLEVWESISAKFHIYLLILILLFSAFNLHQGIFWTIKDNTDLRYSLHIDEVYKISYTLDIDINEKGLKAPVWLMQKGVGYPNLAKILYDVTNNDVGQAVFKWMYGYDLNSMAGLYLFFRSITAGFSLLLAIAVFKLTRLLHPNKYAAVLAAFFMTTIFGAFFSSVIFKSDIPATLFLVCMLISLIQFLKSRSRKQLYLAAIFWGFASVTKYHTTAAGLLFPVVVAIHYFQFKKIDFKAITFAGIAGIISAFILGPFVFSDFAEFINGLQLQKYYQTHVPLQFEEFGFTPLVILNHILYSALGPVLLILFIAAVVYIFIQLFKYKNYIYILPTTYLIIFFSLASATTWIVVRYSIPYFPVISAFSAIFLIELIQYAKHKQQWKYFAVAFITFLLICLHFTYFMAFSKLVRQTNSTVQAANWIRENLEADQNLLHLQLLGDEPLLVYNYGNVNEMVISGKQLDEFIKTYQTVDAIQNYDYLLIDERSYSQYLRLKNSKYENYHKFFDSIMKSDKFKLEKKFEITPEFAGIKYSKEAIPQDLTLISPDILLYKKID
jgi:glycosyltransferase involved in cell wall biosynthesis